MKKKPPLVLYILLGLALAGLAALGYGYVSVRAERSALMATAAELENKIVLLDKKYSEKRALEQQLLRAKTQVEGQVRALHGELEKLRRDKDLLAEEKAETEENLKKALEKAALLDASGKERLERIERLKSDLAEAEKKHANAVKEHQAALDKLTAEKRQMEADLQSELRSVQQKLERSEANNARLALIAEELAEKYKNKGVTTSILQAEPFTQIQKVEIENLLAEYRERIENEKLKKERGGKR